ncbi:MAG: hypothetical protein ABIZ56_06980, partial [Chthoniobacteraceae bacterium]
RKTRESQCRESFLAVRNELLSCTFPALLPRTSSPVCFGMCRSPIASCSFNDKALGFFCAHVGTFKRTTAQDKHNDF